MCVATALMRDACLDAYGRQFHGDVATLMRMAAAVVRGGAAALMLDLDAWEGRRLNA